MRQYTRPSSNVNTTQTFEHTWAVFLLAWVAAFGDAIGFLVLQQLGASFMSGNSMATGAALGHLDWHAAFRSGLPIIVFFLGNMLGFLVLVLARLAHIRSPFSIIFTLELASLLAFLILGSRSLQNGSILPVQSWNFYLCTILLTLTMGLQTTTVRQASGQGISTTFVTGVLSNWANALLQYLPWLHEQLIEHSFLQAMRASWQRTAFRHLLLLSGVWASYVIGAICGSALELRFALNSLIFPMIILVVLIIIDLLQPFRR
ncbi:YoaK family protein [Dictyobacter kobayashii]|uniref:DUF1275 family protein n=1 Tax=Dictyobacter kobayashii TaxID=2014872 RepID=A0A402AR47_9CHLR|nr:YoaK family protein [Dictyobacter kobayashii]GCE21569.1 DUF1275 family protein [Dictyobacter kobayashii]